MLIWRGFYLGPEGDMKPSEGPVFTSRSGESETRYVSADDASRDSDSACFLSRVAGIAPHAVVYLDIDEGCTAAYFAAWVAGVQAHGFTPGVTGSPAAVVLLGERGIDLGLWVFRAIYQEPGSVEREGAEQWVH